jgi:hypothetical protein
VPLDGLLAAAARDKLRPLAQLGDELFHPLAPAVMLLARLDVRLQHSHRGAAYRATDSSQRSRPTS